MNSGDDMSVSFPEFLFYGKLKEKTWSHFETTYPACVIKRENLTYI